MTSNYYTTIPLDPALLATPFCTQTGWYVLTGAACTGKTTLLELLAERGYPVLPESARQYFEAEQANGRSLAEIRRDGGALQRGIIALQVSCERDYASLGYAVVRVPPLLPTERLNFVLDSVREIGELL